MLKLTAFCPMDPTEAVVAALREQSGVKNVFRLPAADVEAGRDVVMAYVPSEAVDAVLGRLRALREWQVGDLSFINVDLVVRHDLAQVDAQEGVGEAADTIARGSDASAGSGRGPSVLEVPGLYGLCGRDRGPRPGQGHADPGRGGHVPQPRPGPV